MSGIDVSAIDFIPLDGDKPMNPIRLRQEALKQMERISALVTEVDANGLPRTS